MRERDAESELMERVNIPFDFDISLMRAYRLARGGTAVLGSGESFESLTEGLEDIDFYWGLKLAVRWTPEGAIALWLSTGYSESSTKKEMMRRLCHEVEHPWKSATKASILYGQAAIRRFVGDLIGDGLPISRESIGLAEGLAQNVYPLSYEQHLLVLLRKIMEALPTVEQKYGRGNGINS